MALQPSAGEHVDRTTQAPFLLRLFWRNTRPLEPYEFSLAPPEDAKDYYNLLPYDIRSQSVEIYTWPSCTLKELTGLLTSVLAPGTLPDPATGTRLVYKLIFPDTRAQVQEGRGKWIDKPLGSVVIGEEISLSGDAEKTLADARFVIGDYIACSIYPSQDGRVVPPPPPPGRPNGGFRRGGPPTGDWRRGERPPGGGYNGYNSGYDGGRGGPGYDGGRGGYRGGRGRPY